MTITQLDTGSATADELASILRHLIMTLDRVDMALETVHDGLSGPPSNAEIDEWRGVIERIRSTLIGDEIDQIDRDLKSRAPSVDELPRPADLQAIRSRAKVLQTALNTDRPGHIKQWQQGVGGLYVLQLHLRLVIDVLSDDCQRLKTCSIRKLAKQWVMGREALSRSYAAVAPTESPYGAALRALWDDLAELEPQPLSRSRTPNSGKHVPDATE